MLVQQRIVTVDLKDVWLNATNHLVGTVTYRELNLNLKVLFVDAVDQLRFVDLPKRFAIQTEAQGI